MPQILRKQIVARELDQAFSNKQVKVTWTATMANGSMLIGAGTEAAAAAIATVAFVINDSSLEHGVAPAVGDVLQVNCITFAAKLHANQLKFSDRVAALADAGNLTALIAKQIELI